MFTLPPPRTEQTLSVAPPASYSHLVAAQRAFFATGTTRPVRWRKEQLTRLLVTLKKYESRLLDASVADMGRSHAETQTIDLWPVYHELKHLRSHLHRWARPKKRLAPLHSFLGSTRIDYQPYGVALIVGAWNYPYFLTLPPLAAAIAAGNTAIVKPSEVAPHSATAIREVIAEAFPPEFVTVVEGGVAETTTLLKERFDYLFYTGSTRVGKIMMQAAAEHLTPVTLELGGKSPCIVDHTVDLDTAARRIAWGKGINAGQTCVAPDYILVHRRQYQPLIERLGHWFTQHYGTDASQSPDYCRIITHHHWQRLVGYLADGTVAFGGQHHEGTRFLAPTLLTDVDPHSPVMQDEIFGPILPILPYDDEAQLLAFVNSREHPLAQYIFSERPDFVAHIRSNTHAGGGCVNDCVMHLADAQLPFGGVGSSGMGRYHGRWGFETFSHARATHLKSTLLDLPFRYPPLTPGKLSIIRRFLG